MAELFRIVTDRAELIWRGPVPPNLGEGGWGTLRFRPLRAGVTFSPETWRVGVPEEVARDPAFELGPRLQEETTYTVLLRSKRAEPVELRHRDPLLFSDLDRPRRHELIHGAVNFRGQVGKSRFEVWAGGRPEFAFEVEVFPTKLDYTSDYEALMAEIQDLTAGLVLEYLRATYHQALPTTAEDWSRLGWIALLRHLVSDLERACRHIASHPVRGLRRISQPVRAERVRRTDSQVRRAVLRGRGFGRRVETQLKIPVRRSLPEGRPRPTLDTPEHRWLTTQLASIRRHLTQIRAEEEYRIRRTQRPGRTGISATLREKRSVRELQQLEDRIRHLEELEPFREAAGLPPPGFTSLQLQGAPGYREAYRVCVILARGLRVNGGPVGLSVKDLHVLYEYWCYLKILRMASDLLDQRIPVERLVEVEADGLRINLRRGRTQRVHFDAGAGRVLEIAYNPSFGAGHSLLAQQPDIVLSLQQPDWPVVRLVMDAKYRLQDDPETVRRFGSPGPPQDAINVLHRYRDAILEELDEGSAPLGQPGLKRTVVEGAALFPLSGSPAASFEHSRFWESLERLGIGALPFLPLETQYVERWLRTVLTRSGWEMAERTIPHGSREQMALWRHAARDLVLVGVLRADDPAVHLEWIRTERRYYTALTPTQRGQFWARFVAVYSPAKLRTPGAVTHVAEVQQIEVRRRKEIKAPWPARRRQDELQVLYRLGPLQELLPPVENLKGTRFSQNRWTTRLGLLRARELQELFLSTEPEWKLYEELRARGVGFALEPGPVVAGEDGLRNRAIFRIGDRQVRYRGAAGFEVEMRGGQAFVGTPQTAVDAVVRGLE